MPLDAASSIGPLSSINRALEPFPEAGNQKKATFISVLSPHHSHPIIYTLLSLGDGRGGALSPLQPLLLSYTALLPSKHRDLSLQNFSLHLVNPMNSITRGGGGDTLGSYIWVSVTCSPFWNASNFPSKILPSPMPFPESFFWGLCPSF